MNRAFNISWRKVGGLTFIKVGRFTFMFCLSRRYTSLHRVAYKPETLSWERAPGR